MPCRRHVTSIAVWLVCQALAANSTAEPDRNPGGSELNTAASSSESSTLESDSPERLYSDAMRLYQNGDRAGAKVKLARCYELTHSPNLLFNLGQVHRELGECNDALAQYQRYLEDAPDGERRKDAAEQVRQLSSECPPPTPTTDPAPPEFPVVGALPQLKLAEFAAISRGSYLSTVGWIAVGTGIFATAATGYFLVATIDAKHDTDRAKSAAVFYPRSDAMYRDSIYTAVFGGTAAVAFGVGVYALLTAQSAAKPEYAAWSITLSPRASALEYRFEF